MSTLHDKYVVIPANCFVSKTHLIQYLSSEVKTLKNNSSNKTYTATTLSKEGIVEIQTSVLSIFDLFTTEDDCDRPSMYWISKLRQNPYKQHYIAGAFKTSILTAVKEGIQSYYDTCYSCSDMNSMLILKNSKELLETLNSRLLSEYNIIETYDCSTLHNSIPHTQ